MTVTNELAYYVILVIISFEGNTYPRERNRTNIMNQNNRFQIGIKVVEQKSTLFTFI